MSIFKKQEWANKEETFYDPKLLLSAQEIEQIKDRNKDNEDVQSLLNDLETYKRIAKMYELG